MQYDPRTLTPREGLRILAGIAIQPFLAAIVVFVGIRVLGLDPSGATLDGSSDATDVGISVAIAAGLVAVLVSLVAALPTAIWLARRRAVSFAEAVRFGLIFGNLPFVAGTMMAGSYGIDGFIRGVALFSLAGSSGAAAFWAIALRKGDPSSRTSRED
jgi:hypothetical protein